VQFATLNGITLHYRATGDFRRQPTIVFANSLGTDFRIWDDVVTGLSADFATLLYDARGHGLSGVGRTPYTIDDHVTDLAALLDHVGTRQAVICGLSAGGQIAIGLAARLPALVQALILCGTAPKIGDRAFWNARIAAIGQAGIASIAEAILARWFAPTFAAEHPAVFAGCRAMLCRQPADGYVASAAAVRDGDLTAASMQITCPTLCLVGEHDQSTSPDIVRALADLVPGAGYAVIPGAGHLPCIERPAVLAEHIRTFVAGLEMESMSHAPE